MEVSTARWSGARRSVTKKGSVLASEVVWLGRAEPNADVANAREGEG